MDTRRKKRYNVSVFQLPTCIQIFKHSIFFHSCTDENPTSPALPSPDSVSSAESTLAPGNGTVHMSTSVAVSDYVCDGIVHWNVLSVVR